jgi:hypothetical protein
MVMRWQDDVAEFARRMAAQHIGYWRENKRERLPLTAAWNRRMALHYLRAAKKLEAQS